MTEIKSFDALTIQDNYLFGAVMEDEEVCREMLERILEIPIDHVSYPQIEKYLKVGYHSHGVRLDVYVKDPAQTVYNVEMQVRAVRTDGISQLPSRIRYNRSIIDVNELQKGVDYTNLPQSFIIFICAFDEFGLGRHRYTFRSMCVEDPALELQEGTTQIVLNTKGRLEDVSPALRRFLDYVEGLSIAQAKEPDAFLQKLDQRVKAIKEDEARRVEYMVLEKMMVDERLLGREEGRASGLAEGRAAGLAEGRAAGLAEGRASGLAEGRAAGLAEGRTSGIREGIHSSITMLRSLHLTDAEIVDKITETFHLTREQAEEYVAEAQQKHFLQS